MCVDLAVLVGHAVSVVQVGEGFRCPPGLQILSHTHRRSHLCPIENGTRAAVELWAASLSLSEKEHHTQLIKYTTSISV